MNHTCNGDFFTANRRKWYRCLLDSAIIRAEMVAERCANCGRPQRGIVEDRVEVRKATLVHVGDFDWQELPE